MKKTWKLRSESNLRIFLSLIVFLSILDAIFTLQWIRIGVAEELNPVMNVLLDAGVGWFLSAKIFLTLAGCSLLWLSKNRKISFYAALGVFLIYAALTLYHLLGALFVILY